MDCALPDGTTLHICNYQPSLTSVLREVKKLEHSSYNNILSIAKDAAFVTTVAQSLCAFQLFANIRCGRWYTRNPSNECYFKSTDGHVGNWSFSTTRLNLHVAMAAALNQGVLIVDATRRGKRFPDSMSRTIPIWAAVLNKVLFKTLELHLPSWVSENEKHQISLRLDGWVNDLESLGTDLQPLSKVVEKPLRCTWIAQGDELDGEIEIIKSLQDTYTLLILISAALPDARCRAVFHGRAFEYVPGAADDQESWARGLTPSLMWDNLDTLLIAGASGLDDAIQGIVQTSVVTGGPKYSILGKTGMVLGDYSSATHPSAMQFVDAILNMSAMDVANVECPYLWLPVATERKDRCSLTQRLPAALTFLSEHLQGKRTVLIACKTGEDVSVCIALACCIGCYDGNYQLLNKEMTERASRGVPADREGYTRTTVKRHLATIAFHHTKARPSKLLLKQVFHFYYENK